MKKSILTSQVRKVSAYFWFYTKLIKSDNPILIHDDLDTSSMANPKEDGFKIPLGWERLSQSRKRKLRKENSDAKSLKKSRVSVGGKAPRIGNKSITELSSDVRPIHEAMQELRSKFQAFRDARPGVNTIPAQNIERTMQCLLVDIKTWIQ